MTYMLLNEVIKNKSLPVHEFFLFNHNNTRSTNSLKLRVLGSLRDVRKFDFCNRIVPIWNSLPDSVVTSYNSVIFLKKLQLICLNIWIRGRN